MNLIPMNNRLIVKRVEEETKTQGGLFLPDISRERPMEGVVMAVGPGKLKKNGERQPMDLYVGDRILFGKYSGSDVKSEGETYLILLEDEVLCKLAPSSVDITEEMPFIEEDSSL